MQLSGDLEVFFFDWIPEAALKKKLKTMQNGAFDVFQIASLYLKSHFIACLKMYVQRDKLTLCLFGMRY